MISRSVPAPTAPSPAPATPSWYGQLQDLPREHVLEPLEVEGTIPADLRGTLYRNGPALMSSFGERYRHLFDGDGGVSAVRFGEGRAAGAVKVVESRGLIEERRAGQRLFGGYGTVQPGLLNRLRGRIKNAANTSVMMWNGRLFALWEGGRPTELAPEDLATLGETDLDGVVIGSFSAHPTRVAARRATYNFGVRYGKQTLIDFYELPDRAAPRRLGSVPLPGPTMVHDFCATNEHLIVLAPPLRMRILRALLGVASFADSLSWRPELGTEVLIVPIAAPSRATRFTVDAFYQWHFSNAFERDGQLVVDLVRYDDFRSNQTLRELYQGAAVDALDGTFHRLTIDPARRTVAAEQRWSRPCEFPRVAPAIEGAPYRFAYLAAGAPGRAGLQSSLVKLDVERGDAIEHELAAGEFISEPVFVPRADTSGGAEDDGYLLAYGYDSARHRTCALVFDARELERGPLARAWFDHHIPLTFHGVWAPAP